MEREVARQSQSEPSNGSQPSAPDPAPSSSAPAPAPVTPTPPRLTPNPLLLDCPAPPTPTTCSPPPPLTPAPTLSTSHITKSTTPTSPHLLVPAPPKLTSTATPALRTYARPILPSPAKTQTLTSTTASITTNSTTSTSAAASLASKLSTTLTNGSSRTVTMTTSTPITPFHTPASPPGRQVSHSLPVGTPGLTRANQSAAPVRQRVSQQTLLLGKGLKGSGQDQVLLRAQMLILTSAMRPSSSSSAPSTPASTQLQSLTLRPPPPGALTIPPSLRLKPPTSSSAPPPLSRPQTPLFPPLRPRPITTTSTESTTTTPGRHLSVPPPTLYSPVRAVPLRPRLLSPNGHRSPAPKQPLHHIAAPSSTGPSPINRPISGLKTCPLSPTILSPGQHPPSASMFERSPSAARQLQIIALSSGRQLQTNANVSSQNRDSETVLPLSPTLAKTSSPLPSPNIQKANIVKDVEKLKPESQEGGTVAKDFKAVDQREKENSRIEKEDVIEAKKARLEEKINSGAVVVTEEGQSCKKGNEEKKITAAEIKITDQSKSGQNQNREVIKDSNSETRQRISTPVLLPSPVKSSPPSVQNSNPESIQAPVPVTVPVRPQNTPPISLSSGLSIVPPAMAVENSSPLSTVTAPVTSPVSVAVQEVTPNQSQQKFTELQSPNQSQQRITELQSTNQSQQRIAELQSTNQSQQRITELQSTNQSQQRITELQSTNQSQQRLTELNSTNQDDNMSIQSDNQSALSSLSSQSPPSSPFVSPSTDTPLHPPQPERPTDLSLNHKREQTQNNISGNNHELHTEPEHLIQSEDEESFNQSESSPWEPRAWPEGQQVLTHLVEGFVIQEGLTPFPVNRSSLLVAEKVTKTQEVNGTNGSTELPVTTETRKQAEQHSTDSEEEEGGDTDDRPSQRDRAVLHCQFCGKRGHAHNFMRSKRFCSTSCARGFNVRLTKRLRALSAGSRSEPRPRPALTRAESVPGKPLLIRLPKDLWSAGCREKELKDKRPTSATAEEEEEEEMELEAEAEEDDDEDDDGPEEEEEEEEDEPVAMTTTTNNNSVAIATTNNMVQQHRARRASAPAVTSTFRPTPSQWSVEEVTAFINTLPGCGDVAEAFRVQEIDGQALLLLTEDHLMTSMNIKLGPALKICAHINTLKNQ